MITFKKKPDTEKKVLKILTPTVKSWFKSKYPSLSLPQLFGIHEIHSRNNILVSAPTGATKTLTGFMSILNELVDSAEKGILQDKVYCVYISPLKALNRDIELNLLEPLDEMEAQSKKKFGIRVAVRTGDTTASEKARMLKKSPHILITTPESLALMLSSPKFKGHLKDVQWVITDEIHALADSKRGVHLSLSLERLQKLSPAMCRIGLSATVSPLEDIAKYLVGVDRPCKIVDVQFLKELDLEVLSPVPDLVNTSHETLNQKSYELIDSLVQQHKTTLIFTNTRAGTERIVYNLKTLFPKNYYEIHEGPPTTVASLIGAHHGSLSKEHRFQIEDALKKGKLKAVSCSTSLELGLDIGFIDLVICLGSPKSVARLLQRAGRAGHQLHSKVKARIIVYDRDDLVECSVMLKHALEKKIDKVHIPTNCLDVLAQQIFGMIIEQPWDVRELYETVKQSYCYSDLNWQDFDDILSYLAGEYALENRNIYARIWYNRDEGKVGKKGKMTRVIYMTNIGTIPDQSGITVKIRERKIGKIDEGFLEKLKRGDIFVLGGDCYQFLYSRGMVVQVRSASGRKPTVPSWYSESLPLSFDLAVGVQKFRRLMEEKFVKKIKKDDIIKFINDYLFVDKNASEALYSYMKEQYCYVGIAHERQLCVEHYNDGEKKHVIFHALYGRRVNDTLSRAIAFAIARSQHKDVEIGLSDNGFMLSFTKDVQVTKAFKLLKPVELRKLMDLAIDKSEVYKRRFRHCAMRAMMILRVYKGQKKNVGRQQVSSMILMSALRRISEKFVILKEAKREVLEDLMDIDNAVNVLEWLNSGRVKLKSVSTDIPSPFAFNLALQGYSDILKVEDKMQFLQKMHNMILAKIALKEGKKKKN